jgi:SAM-dependent methyltransferase
MKTMLLSILDHFPWLKKLMKRVRNYLLPSSNVSTHYVSLGTDEVSSEAERLRNAWQDEGLPLKQRDLVDQQLRKYRAGTPIDVFDVMLNALRELPELQLGMSLLEVGCSSGFYSEVFEIAGLPIQYSGCDYSEAFIQLACARYPLLDFSVADATQLDYPTASFDLVVSGCCLLHIPEYVKGIK